MTWLERQLRQLLPRAPERLLQQLARRARAHTLDKSQVLLPAGTRWQHLWWVEQGALRLYYIDRQGAEANKNFMFEGQCLWPVTPRLRDEPVDFFVAALEPTRVQALPMADVQDVMADQPDWAALQLRALQQLLDEKLWREHLFLQCTPAQRYLALRAARPAWCERLPLRQQAAWLGITDVSLSRLRSRLGLREAAALPAAT